MGGKGEVRGGRREVRGRSGGGEGGGVRGVGMGGPSHFPGKAILTSDALLGRLHALPLLTALCVA
jgi:hypothetical protein